jgi:hypothetical protein
MHSSSLHPLTAQLAVGMRLEAVDRKNPHLVCVATIAGIDTARPDSLLIHFDGWTETCVWCLVCAVGEGRSVGAPCTSSACSSQHSICLHRCTQIDSFPHQRSHAHTHPCRTSSHTHVSYDYWAEPSSADLHPIGWCAANGKDLQKPKGHDGTFAWSAYLRACKAVAAPTALLPGPGNAEARISSQPDQVELFASACYLCVLCFAPAGCVCS